MHKILATALGLFSLLASCNDKKNNDPVSTLPQREGTGIESTTAKYNDVKPSLSAAGTRLVFISGRETEGAAAALKVFKVEWPDPGVPGTPTRLTSSDIGFERLARLSPDGNWVLIIAEKDSKTTLYLQDFAGLNGPVAITTDDADQIAPSFSPDSAHIAWISRDVASGLSKVVGVSVGTGTAADLATMTPLSVLDGDSKEYVTNYFWIPTTTPGTYSLAIGTQSSVSSSVSINTILFTSLASAQTATRTAWLKELFLVSSAVPRASVSAALIGRKIPADSDKKVAAIPGGANPRMTPVAAEPVFAATSGTLTALATPPGYDLTALGGITTDGTMGFGLFRLAYRHTCNATLATYDFGTVIASFKADGSATKYFVPRTSADEGLFEVGSSVCDTVRADGTQGRNDDKIMDVVVSASAAPTKGRAVYVTRFTQHFDELCRLKAGDPEIFGIDMNDTTSTIQPISNNRAPIADSPTAAGVAACKL